MIKLIIPRHDEAIYNNYIGVSLRKINVAVCDAWDVPNERGSIFVKYNRGIEAYNQKGGINPNDIVMFVHEDVQILDPDFLKKLEYIFKEKKEVGLVGFCGTTELTKKGGWHLTDQKNLRGHVMQEFNGQINHNIYGNKIGYFDDICAVDGFCFAIRGKLFNEGLRFDSSLSDFDFYDLDISLQVLEKGYKVVIVDILFQHKSEGKGILKRTWEQSRQKFIAKWMSKGKQFPLTTKQFKLRDFSEEENDQILDEPQMSEPIEIEI